MKCHPVGAFSVGEERDSTLHYDQPGDFQVHSMYIQMNMELKKYHEDMPIKTLLEESGFFPGKKSKSTIQHKVS